MEIPQLMQIIRNENASLDDIEKATQGIIDDELGDLVIPNSVSPEATLVEITTLTKRLYELHNKQKRDPVALTKLIALLELKTKIVGMMNVKPDVQAIIDSEINVYKTRFLQLAYNCVEPKTLEVLCEKLAAEGL